MKDKVEYKNLTVEFIQMSVCLYLRIAIERLQLKTRKREVVKARQISSFFAKRYSTSTLEYIGNKIGGVNHDTVIHSVRTVQNMYDNYKTFRPDIDELDKFFYKQNEIKQEPEYNESIPTNKTSVIVFENASETQPPIFVN